MAESRFTRRSERPPRLAARRETRRPELSHDRPVTRPVCSRPRDPPVPPRPSPVPERTPRTAGDSGGGRPGPGVSLSRVALRGGALSWYGVARRRLFPGGRAGRRRRRSAAPPKSRRQGRDASASLAVWVCAR